MRVISIEKVLPCISDPWKLRVILLMDKKPNLKELADVLDARYSEKLGVAILQIGVKEINLFSTGKVTITQVEDEKEAEKLVNALLAMAEHKLLYREL
ncbi:MAG: hypothetical protein ACE5KT_03100 [Methanosarcinales archaeon]